MLGDGPVGFREIYIVFESAIGGCIYPLADKHTKHLKRLKRWELICLSRKDVIRSLLVV